MTENTDALNILYIFVFMMVSCGTRMYFLSMYAYNKVQVMRLKGLFAIVGSCFIFRMS